jgi:hypothetical protein
VRRAVIWPTRFTARFAPRLEILDASGAIVFRAGDKIEDACTAGGAGDPGDLLLLRPGS